MKNWISGMEYPWNSFNYEWLFGYNSTVENSVLYENEIQFFSQSYLTTELICKNTFHFIICLILDIKYVAFCFVINVSNYFSIFKTKNAIMVHHKALQLMILKDSRCLCAMKAILGSSKRTRSQPIGNYGQKLIAKAKVIKHKSSWIMWWKKNTVYDFKIFFKIFADFMLRI